MTIIDSALDTSVETALETALETAVQTAVHIPIEPWVDVCDLARLVPDRGVAAKLAARQVAVFLLSNDDVYAVDNHDPYSGANVMSRGLVGDRQGQPYVASPMYKQRFDLRSGVCLDDPEVRLGTYPVMVSDGRVRVASGPPPY